jgi:hypothetical protein
MGHETRETTRKAKGMNTWRAKPTRATTLSARLSKALLISRSFVYFVANTFLGLSIFRANP